MSRAWDDFTDECAGITASLLLAVVVMVLYGLVLAIPGLFKLAVALTGGLLGWLDEAFDGRLSEDEALSLLAAGGIWTLISLPLILLIVLPIALTQDLTACLLIPVLLLPGFLLGLVCGYQAIQESDDAMGEREALDWNGLFSFSYDGYGDLEDLIAEGVILGEGTSNEWFFG